MAIDSVIETGDSMPAINILDCPKKMFRWTRQQQANGELVGVVPTMGALHEGHLSLVEAARARCEKVVVTIFVNPTQFGPNEDYERYPRTLQKDVGLLSDLGVDCVFAPSKEDMYPQGSSTTVAPPAVATMLEGECRPEHFGGVCTIVLNLLQIVPADLACFGQKDFQQALVIRNMVRDLNLPTEVAICPIKREPDGLAMSSRNVYLDAGERKRALSLVQALRQVPEAIGQGIKDTGLIETRMKEFLRPFVDRIDYAVVVDSETLECLEAVDRTVVGLIAAYIGKTRLIDNCVVSVAGETDLLIESNR